MTWWAWSAVVRRQDLERRCQDLFRAGASGVQEDHLPGEAPAPRQPWDSGPVAPPSARVLLRAWVEADDPPTDEAFRDGSFAEEPPHDWEAEFRSGFRAERVSERITVAPPWDAPPGAVIIEPGQGFGTGAHETTRAALRALDRWCVGCRTVLDVGCGSGVLALAGARLGLRARGVDVEAAAVREARRAARVNGLRATFSTRPVASLVTPADLVVANLHAELIVALARPLRRLTRRRLILAGILADREALVTARFADWELLGRDVDGEWVCHVWAAEPGSET